jgi:hypothetical protein
MRTQSAALQLPGAAVRVSREQPNKGLQRTGAEGARGLPPARVITNGAHSARLR